jgi:hypothetical protein
MGGLVRDISRAGWLAPEALAKIGIKTATVSAMDSRTAIQIAGTVMPNAYAEVKVTPIAAGIVTKTHGDLGTAVRRAPRS